MVIPTGTRNALSRRPRPGAVSIPRTLAPSQQAAHVAVPRALEEFCGVVLALQCKKRSDHWIPALDLILPGPTVVGQVIGSAVRETEIDQRAKRVGGMAQAQRRMFDVEVEKHACIPLACPGEVRLVIALDH